MSLYLQMNTFRNDIIKENSLLQNYSYTISHK